MVMQLDYSEHRGSHENDGAHHDRDCKEGHEDEEAAGGDRKRYPARHAAPHVLAEHEAASSVGCHASHGAAGGHGLTSGSQDARSRAAALDSAAQSHTGEV